MRIVGISDLVADIYYDEKLNIIGAFGGISACNIICNLQYFGFNTFIYGVCGNDYLGKMCIDSLNDCNVKNDILILDNIKTKAYQIRKIKENNREVFRSIKYCPICKESTWYEDSYIDEIKILKQIKKDDIILFDNLNNKNQYIIDNTNNIKLLDLGTFDELERLNTKEIINKITNKFEIINLNERVEKYLIKRLNLKDGVALSKVINSKLLIVTRGIKGNDFIYQGIKYTFPILKIVNEVDDSGAGDAFFSVIIKNWLNNKRKLDNLLFDKWVNDTKPLVSKVLKLIGSRSFIYPLYQINKKDICSYKYKIYIPSGNPTALVIGIEYDLKRRKQINDEIMQKYDFVEQVGFINPNKPELLMAGGEFCGNATRCAVSYYLKNQPGKIKIKVSGVRNKLNAGIDKNNNVWVDMPIIKGDYQKFIKVINDTSSIIKMHGITHIVMETGDINKKYNEKELKKYAFNLLKQEKLLNRSAAGVIFANKIDKKNIAIYPVVYVSEINTLFYETACGSGTTALAIYDSMKEKNSVNINVLQPSGMIINVKTEFNNQKIDNVRISGKVNEYREGDNNE